MQHLTPENFPIAVNHALISFIYLFLAALGPCSCAWAFSGCGELGLLFPLVHRRLSAVASLWSTGFRPRGFGRCSIRARQLHLGSSLAVTRVSQSEGLRRWTHGLSWPTACGIPPGWRLNLCPLHWQTDSYPLYLQRSPAICLLTIWYI